MFSYISNECVATPEPLQHDGVCGDVDWILDKMCCHCCARLDRMATNLVPCISQSIQSKSLVCPAEALKNLGALDKFDMFVVRVPAGVDEGINCFHW